MEYAQGMSEEFHNGHLVGSRRFETDGRLLAINDGGRVRLVDVEQMVSHPSKKSLMARLEECSRHLQRPRRRKRYTRSKRSKKSKKTRRRHRRRRRSHKKR